MLLAVDELWLDGWRGPSLLACEGDTVSYAGPADATTPRIPVTVLPGFVDSHVHLGLIDPSRLAAGGIARVLDLGWIPDVAQRWVSYPDTAWPAATIAGAFLTTVDGYPSRTSWAPAGSTHEIASPAAIPGAIAARVAAGARVIKITLNSVAGPVFDDGMLRAIIDHTHRAGLLAVVHAEGTGQAARAAAAGADLLAHTPFTERLSDEELRSMAGRCGWISTLDIHRDDAAAFGIAVDNLARFHALDGRVLYGTDLGNGPLPLGVNVRELRALAAAGLDESDILRSLVGPLDHRLSVIATPRTDDFPAWLATATVMRPTELAAL